MHVMEIRVAAESNDSKPEGYANLHRLVTEHSLDGTIHA